MGTIYVLSEKEGNLDYINFVAIITKCKSKSSFFTEWQFKNINIVCGILSTSLLYRQWFT